MTKEKASKTTNNKARSGHRKVRQVNASKASSQGTPKPSATNSTSPVEAPMLTQEQIAKRAKEIWQARGCVPGLDEQNWYEAEVQLKSELKVH